MIYKNALRWFALALTALFIPTAASADGSYVWKKVYELASASSSTTLAYVGSGGAGQMVATGAVDNGQGQSEPFMLVSANGSNFTKTNPPASQSQFIPFTMLGSFSMINETVGYAGNLLGGIAKTGNKGANWVWCSYPPKEPANLNMPPAVYDVQCLSENECFAVGGKLKVWHTTDGFATGTESTVPVSNSEATITSVHFLDANVGYVAGGYYVTAGSDQQKYKVKSQDGFVYKTTDGGAHWTGVMTDSSTYFTKIFFVNAQLGFAGGEIENGTGVNQENYKARLFKTTDGGAHWTEIIGAQGSAPIPEKALDGTWAFLLAGIYFSDANNGWVVVNYGQYNGINTAVYYHTTDGGASFTAFMDEAGKGHTINDVAFCGDNCGWAVGSSWQTYRLGTPAAADGDADGTDNADNGGDNVVVDGETIGPGDPGQPCLNPFQPSLPECKADLGAATCLFNDQTSMCTRKCALDSQCGMEYESCCKQMTVDGVKGGYCIFDYNVCKSGGDFNFSTGGGAKLGEHCKVKGDPNTADFPECGAAWGATICIGSPEGSFCSKSCSQNLDCPASNCCADLAEDGNKFCVYPDAYIKQFCTNAPDGDEETVETAENADVTTDNAAEKTEATGAKSSGGCGTFGAEFAIIAAFAALLLAAGRRKRAKAHNG